MTSARIHPLLAAATVATAAYFIQCGPEEETVALPPVVYGGDASDEALERVWPKIATAESSATLSARISAPANGAALPAGSSPTFSWSLVSGAYVPGIRQPSPASEAPGSKALAFSFGSAIAEAHLPPVTGEVYLLEFITGAGEANPLRVFTTDTSWTADPDSWNRLKAAGGSITLKIYNAYLNQNIVEEGPYASPEPVAFTVSPS